MVLSLNEYNREAVEADVRTMVDFQKASIDDFTKWILKSDSDFAFSAKTDEIIKQLKAKGYQMAVKACYNELSKGAEQLKSAISSGYMDKETAYQSFNEVRKDYSTWIEKDYAYLFSQIEK